MDPPDSSVRHPTNFAMAMTTVLLWAAAFPVIKVALDEGVPPVTLALVRFGIASVFFMAVLFILGDGIRAVRALDRRLWAMVIAFGIIQSAVTNIAQNIGMQWTTAGLAAIIQSVGPVIAVVLAIGVLGERYTHMKALGGVMAIAGTVGIVTGGGQALGEGTFLGNMLMVVTASAYAVGGTIAKRALRDIDTTTLMGVGTPFSLVPLAIWALAVETPADALAEGSATAWSSILFLGLVATGITMILWYRVLARVELSQLSYFVYLIPVISVVLSFVVLGETVTLVQVLFAALIILGVAVAQRERPEAVATVAGMACEEGPCEDEE